MKEIDANKKAWGTLSEDHYHTFKKALEEEEILLNDLIVEELGDISGKSLIHLQCNTGADTISLARLGAKVTGVDLVPENIFYAKKLAADFGIDADFIESDIMELQSKHDQKYDIVFVSEGAIGWLPDLRVWAQTIRHLLKDDGFLYVLDSHPFMLTLNEGDLAKGQLDIEYPYFSKKPDLSKQIGGYASEVKEGDNYFWMYTISDLINSLSAAGLHIEFFNEYDQLYFNLGGMDKVAKGFYQNPFFKGKLPFSFSLRATVR